MQAPISLADDSAFAADGAHEALSERIRRRLTDLIRNRTLIGGHVIIEQRLAEQLGVSRTPLREALQRLEGEGMIAKNSGRSYTVRKVDFQEYMQSLKMRLILEPEAAAMAVGRIPAERLRTVRREVQSLHGPAHDHTEAHWDSDDRLHRLYGAQCGNAVMFDVIERLRVTTRLYEISDIRQRVDSDFSEHCAILDALEAEDAEAAKAAVAGHIRSLITYAIEQIER